MSHLNEGAATAPTMPTRASAMAPAKQISRREAEARRAANVLQRLATSGSRTAASLWGPDRRGLTAALFDKNGETLLTPRVQLIINDAGRVTGFTIDGQPTDYAKPHRVQSDSAAPVLFAGSNFNVSRLSGRTPAEERLVRALREGPVAGVLAEQWAPDTNSPERLPMRLANTIAKGVVAEALRNAVGPSRAGALNLTRAFGISIRQRLIRLLLRPDDNQADWKRDMLLSAPILALAPHAIASNAMASPKQILREALGLTPAAMRILPKAVSPIAAYLAYDDEDENADPKTLQWLKPELCAALPNTENDQLRVLKFAASLLLTHMPADAVAQRATWAARNYEPLFKEGIPPLRDWMSAELRLLKRVGLQPWHGAISAEEALYAGKELERALAIAADPARGTPFKLPRWATYQTIQHSTYYFTPAKDEVELIALGRRARNCVAAYAGMCRDGETVIGELNRTVAGKTTIGAVVEFALFNGKWHIAQIAGVANSDPQSAAERAARTILEVANGGAR